MCLSCMLLSAKVLAATVLRTRVLAANDGKLLIITGSHCMMVDCWIAASLRSVMCAFLRQFQS